jgi:hypothetical protein
MGEASLNDKEHALITTVMDMISGTLDIYEVDQAHAPAKWLLENWWCTLNAALQVGDQAETKLNSFKPTDQTESEKGDQNIQTDQPFEV